MFKICFYAKSAPRKRDGLYLIMGRVTMDGQRVQFTTNVYMDKTHIAYINAPIRKLVSSDLYLIMKELLHIRQQMVGIYNRIRGGQNFSANTLINVFKKERELSDIYFLHSLKEIIADKKRQGVSRKTIEKYTLLSNRLQSFILLKYKKTDLSVNEINDTFIVSYRRYLKRTFQYSQISLEKLMQLFQSARTAILEMLSDSSIAF